MKIHCTKVRSALFLTTCGVAAVAGLPQAAMAQEAPAQEAATVSPPSAAEESAASRSEGGVFGQDIVVTAQRREQNLQDVAIAITAVSGEQITTLGLSSSTDLAKLASNVSLSGSYGGLMSNFTIRGVTQNDFNDHVESVIATYIDDTYIGMQQGTNFAMFDIDRVEALKGPQGTLFGRNATGGLVQYISRRPTDHFEAFLDATYASYDNVRLEGALSGPLASGINARLAAMFERSDGYLKNDWPENTYTVGGRPQGTPLTEGGDDLGGIKSNFAIRGQVDAALSDNVQLWVSGTYSKMVAGSAPYQMSDQTISIQDANGVQLNTIFDPNATCSVLRAGVCAAGFFDAFPTRPAPGTDFYGYTDPDGRGLHTSIDYAFDDGSRAKSYGGSGKLTVEMGDVNLTSITDYKHFDKNFQFDLVPDPANAYFWIAQANVDQFSQELRLDGKTGGLQWVVGGYFLRIKNDSVNGLGALPGSLFGAAFQGDEPRIMDLVSKSYSLFGQLEYELSDTLTLVGGLRASREIKDYTFDVLFVPTVPGDDPRDFEYAGGISELHFADKSKGTLWNWKAQLNFKPVDDVLLYVGVTQGQKAGSFNSGGPTDFASPAAIPYKAERLVSYETGFKTSLFDRRLRFNGAVYYYDYHDYQASQWTGLSNIIVNADARFYGAEVELAGSPVENLDISFNAGWQKNKVKDVLIAGAPRDVETTFAPEWTLSGLARYTIPADVAGGKVALQASASYQSRVWHNLNNFDANYLPGRTVVDGRIDWTDASERFTIAVFAKNIFNKHYPTVGFDESYVTGGSMTSPARPRWIGVNARISM